MGKIGLVETFSLIPEGWHNFRIEKVEHKETFNKVVVTLKSEKGYNYQENYAISHEGALKAFSFFAKTALQDMTNREIDTEELVGKYISIEIVHEKVPSKDDPTNMLTFANSKNKKPCNGFGEQAVDIDKLLGTN